MMKGNIRPRCRRRLWLMATLFMVFTITAAAQETDEVLISNVFVETDLRQALQDVSAQVGIPIIPDAFVQGLVSVEFYDVPLETCLEMLLYPLGFTYQNLGFYYVVTSLNPRSPNFDLVSRTERIPLNHVKAEDAIYNLPSFLLTFVRVNRERNTLTISAPESIIRRMKEEIALIDIPVKQVSIEVTVTELSEDAVDKIGLEWSEEIPLSVAGDYQLDVGDDIVSTFQLVGDLAKQTLLSVQLMARQGEAQIRANPRILAADAAEAVIDIGTDKYVAVESGSGGTSYTRLQTVSAGIKLKIVPFIGEEGNIILEVETEVSDILPGSAADIALSVARRSASTTVHVNDGQTIGIGGLVQENREESTTGVPLLGDIPVIDNLFSSEKQAGVRTELIIFITPRIIQPGRMEAAGQYTERQEPQAKQPAEEPPDETGLRFTVETGITNAIDDSRIFYLMPGFSYDLFGTGLVVHNTWEIPLLPRGTVRPVLSELLQYEFGTIPVSIRLENSNVFPLDHDPIGGFASLQIGFAKIFKTELVFTYLPEIDLGLDFGLEHEFAFDGGFSLGFGGGTSISFLADPGLHYVVFHNYYSYSLARLGITVGAEPRIDFLVDGTAVFDISPYARIDLSL